MTFKATLATIRKDMEEEFSDLVQAGEGMDPDGEGTVNISTGLFFTLLGIVTWLSTLEEEDGNDPS